MKVKLVKTVIMGEVFIKLFVDDQPSEYGREITGHTTGQDAELISRLNYVHIRYGKHVGYFTWDDHLWSKTAPFTEAAAAFLKRVERIRNWVEKCKAADNVASGAIEIEL